MPFNEFHRFKTELPGTRGDWDFISFFFNWFRFSWPDGSFFLKRIIIRSVFVDFTMWTSTLNDPSFFLLPAFHEVSQGDGTVCNCVFFCCCFFYDDDQVLERQNCSGENQPTTAAAGQRRKLWTGLRCRRCSRADTCPDLVPFSFGLFVSLRRLRSGLVFRSPPPRCGLRKKRHHNITVRMTSFGFRSWFTN